MKTPNQKAPVEETPALDFDTYRNIAGHKLYIVVEGKQKMLEAGAELRALVSLRDEMKRFSAELMRLNND